jgi:predicted  nucleic acid-binding Zn-ribbon protein
VDGQLKTLIDLQTFDTRIAGLEGEAAKLPKEIEALRARIAEAKKTVDTAKAGLDATRKETRAREKDLEDNQVKRQKFEGQLYQVKTNKEYSAVLAEIEEVKQQKSKIEEEILTLMERQERLAGEIKDAEGGLKAAESEGAVAEKQLRERLAAVEAELGGVKGERASVARGLPANVLTDYDRLLRARSGLAIVPVLKPNLCGACRMTVTPQRLQELRAQNALLACESCGRYLYWQA